MNWIPAEEMIKKLEEVFEWMKKHLVEIIGSKANPYYCYCNNEIYKKFKEELPLDENDMYFTINGWVKVINVDKPFKVEVKPYEVKKKITHSAILLKSHFIVMYLRKIKKIMQLKY